MADGTTYEIDVKAEEIGVDATADDIHALADSLEAAEKVTTQFDNALKAAGVQLEQAGAAAAAANAGLNEAEATYKRLERASIRAGKAVEKAAAKGKDTTQLQVAADAAAAALREQGSAVDMARNKATAAASAEKKLAASFKEVQRAADKAASKVRTMGKATDGARRSAGDLTQASQALGGALGGRIGQVTQLIEGFGKGGWVGVAILAVAATLLSAGAFAFLAAKMLKFAIASDKVVSKRFERSLERTHKRIKALFEGVRTDKLVKPVNKLLQLFDKNTASGRALAKLIEDLMNPLIDGIVEALPLAKEFFKGMILGALRVIIVVLRLRNAILRAIPKETREKAKKLIDTIFSLEGAAKGGEMAFYAIAIVLGLVAVAATIAAAAIILLTLALLAVPIAIALVTAHLFGFFDEAPDKAKKAGKETGKGLGEGIIDGIGAIVGKVVDAATKMADSVISAVKNKLKSKSPSLVFRDIALGGIGAGMVAGLDRATPMVRASSRQMAEAAEEAQISPLERIETIVEPAREGASPGDGGDKRRNITIENLNIQAPSGDADDIKESVREVFLELLDGTALQLGGGEVVAMEAT